MPLNLVGTRWNESLPTVRFSSLTKKQPASLGIDRDAIELGKQPIPYNTLLARENLPRVQIGGNIFKSFCPEGNGGVGYGQ